MNWLVVARTIVSVGGWVVIGCLLAHPSNSEHGAWAVFSLLLIRFYGLEMVRKDLER